jgi:hypothetical protein
MGTWLRKFPVILKIYAISKDPVGHLVRYVVRRPRLKKLGINVLRPFPILDAKLKEIRAAQIRSDFISQYRNVIGRAESEANQRKLESSDILSLISLNRRHLTVDEILIRIRWELAQVKMEK